MTDLWYALLLWIIGKYIVRQIVDLLQITIDNQDIVQQPSLYIFESVCGRTLEVCCILRICKEKDSFDQNVFQREVSHSKLPP